MNLAVLRPVFERLLPDSRLRVRFTGPERADLAAAFQEHGIAESVVDRGSVRWRRFDLYVNADPWEAVKLPPGGPAAQFLSRSRREVQPRLPDRPSPQFQALRPRRVSQRRPPPRVCRGRARAGRPGRAGRLSESGRADLAEPPMPERWRHRWGSTDARPTVIFAPTFSPASALNYAGEEIVETLLASGCNVIAKLHDRSLDPDPRYTGGIDWRGRFARFSGPQFLLATGGDSTPYVLASDVMVTDHSSIGFEFCAADRPIVVFDAPGLIEAARINPEKVALLRSAAAVVSTTGQLAEAIRDALATPHLRSAERHRAADEVFFHAGHGHRTGAPPRLRAAVPAVHPDRAGGDEYQAGDHCLTS